MALAGAPHQALSLVSPARGEFLCALWHPGRERMLGPKGGHFTENASLDEVATRQLGADKRCPGSGIPRQSGYGRPSTSLVPVLTCGRDSRTLFVSKERRNTILILHEPCHSAAQPLVLCVRIPSMISLRPIYLMCRATGAAVRRACSRTTHKILSILGKDCPPAGRGRASRALLYFRPSHTFNPRSRGCGREG